MTAIDLHMHSLLSLDGELSPVSLVERCAAHNIKIMAIADHNVARAYRQAAPAAKAAGITLIPGVELDCAYKGVNLHVLCYGANPADPIFDTIEQDFYGRVAQASVVMLQKTRELGFEVTDADLLAATASLPRDDCYTGEMFAEILLAKPQYAAHPLLLPYRPGGARSDNPLVNFYWDYYSQGKPCAAEFELMPFEQLLEKIHASGGKAVLAHPGVNLKARPELFFELAERGLDGVEAFSSYHTPEVSQHYYELSKQLHLIATCGSDFHGKTKPAIEVGGHNSTVPDSELLPGINKLINN